jgi:hypothetical protein
MSETTEAVTDATLTPSPSVGGASIAANAAPGSTPSAVGPAQGDRGGRRAGAAVRGAVRGERLPGVRDQPDHGLRGVHAGVQPAGGLVRQIGLAHAALFAIGAYGSAIGIDAGIPFLVTIPLAASRPRCSRW